MKNILLIGASGFVGSAILKEALERGHSVTALIRDPAKLTIRHPNLNAVSGNASSADEITCTAKGMDVVISAYNPGWKNPNIYQEILATYPAIIAGTKRAGVGRLLVVGGSRQPERHTGQESDRIGTDSGIFAARSQRAGRSIFAVADPREETRLGLLFPVC